MPVIPNLVLTNQLPINTYTASLVVSASNFEGFPSHVVADGLGNQIKVIELTASYAFSASVQQTYELSSSWASASMWATSASFTSRSFSSTSASFASQSFVATTASFASRSFVATTASWASASGISVSASFASSASNNVFNFFAPSASVYVSESKMGYLDDGSGEDWSIATNGNVRLRYVGSSGNTYFNDHEGQNFMSGNDQNISMYGGLVNVSSSGVINSYGPTTGSAAPVTLAGYLQILISGSTVWVPYYTSP